MAQLLLRPTEETVKNAFYGRPLVGVSPHPPTYPPSPRVLPPTYITRRKCAAQYVQSKLRRPRRRPSFFPAICARIYGRTFVCRPQYMGDVIIVIRGLPPRRTGIGAPLRTGSDISDKAKLFKTSQHTSFPLSQQRHRAAVMLLQRMQSFR